MDQVLCASFLSPICLGNISEANRTLELEFLRSSGLCNSISLCIDKTWFTSPTSLKSRVAVDCQYFIQFFISFGFSWWGVCICRQERIKCNCFQVNLLNISKKNVLLTVCPKVFGTPQMCQNSSGGCPQSQKFPLLCYFAKIYILFRQI